MATRKRRRKNPLVSDFIKGNITGTLISKAKDHVIGYYAKKAKKGRRKNPDIVIPTSLDNTMLPANDVAELLGGEFIPLKGMIIGDDEIQLITEPGVRLTNGAKSRIKNKLSNPISKSYLLFSGGKQVDMANSLREARAVAARLYRRMGATVYIYDENTHKLVGKATPDTKKSTLDQWIRS